MNDTIKVTTGWAWDSFNRKHYPCLRCVADWRFNGLSLGTAPAHAVVADINVRRTELGLPLLELV